MPPLPQAGMECGPATAIQDLLLWLSTLQEHLGTVSIHSSASSSSTHPPAREQGRGWRDVWVTRVLGRWLCPSERECGSCHPALWPGEHQKMLWAKIRIRAQRGYREETHGEALGRNQGNLPSSIERSPPLWALSSPAKE